MSESNPTPAQSTRRLIGEKATKPLYLDHPDLIAQVRAIDPEDPQRSQQYEVIKAEAQRRHDAKSAAASSST